MTAADACRIADVTEGKGTGKRCVAKREIPGSGRVRVVVPRMKALPNALSGSTLRSH